MRTKNTINNFFASIGSQIIILLLTFISRKVFLQTLGLEQSGLNGLFTNIISMFSVTELGIGAAITYCLYEPIAKKNYDEISSYMKLYKKVYSIIAIIITVLGLLTLVVIDKFVGNTTLSISYIRIVFLFFVFNSVISYLISYKRTIFYSMQKEYQIIKLDLICNSSLKLVQIIILYLTQNYILFLLIQSIMILTNNIIISKKADREYNFINNKSVNIDIKKIKIIYNDIKKRVLIKISNLLVFSTDNMIISYFIGVSSVGLFQNYNLIFNTISGLIEKFYQSVEPSLGNIVYSEDKDKTYSIFKQLDIIGIFLASVGSICFFVLVDIFITIWIGKNFILNKSILILLILQFYLSITHIPQWRMCFLSAKLDNQVYLHILRAFANLIISVYLARKIGLEGVILGTVISQVITWIGEGIILSKEVLKEHYLVYWKKHFIFFGNTIIQIIISNYIFKIQVLNNNISELLIKAFLCIIFVIISNVLLMYKLEEFKALKNIGIKIIKGIKEKYKIAI